jgi:hypothetical protein
MASDSPTTPPICTFPRSAVRSSGDLTKHKETRRLADAIGTDGLVVALTGDCAAMAPMDRRDWR